MAQIGFGEHDAGEERAEREGDVEQMRRAVCDAERDREDGESEQLARAGARDLVQDPRHDAPAADEHQRDEHRDLECGRAQAESAAMLASVSPLVPASAGRNTNARTIARSSTISQPTAM